MATPRAGETSLDYIFTALDSPVELDKLQDSEYEREYERFTCEYAGQKRDVLLRRPAQYRQLLQRVEHHFGRRLSMEFAVSKGEVYVALTCQNDLDSLIELINSTRSAHSGFNVHLFTEPPPISSASGVFIQSPDAQPELMHPFGSASHNMSPPPGTIRDVPFPQSCSTGSSSEGLFIPEPDSPEYEHVVADDSSRMGRFFPAPDDSCYESVVTSRSNLVHSRYSVPAGFDSSRGALGRQPPVDQQTTNSPAVQHSLSMPAVTTASSSACAPVNWRRGRKLGAGSFGQVYVCHDRDVGRDLAVKLVSVHCSLDDASKELEALQSEIRILERLQHPRIVRYCGCQSYDDGSLAIFMEYMPGGSVQDQIKEFGALTETLTRRYTRQVLEGLGYLHEMNIIHRDIKGANILRDNVGNVKLGDFGTSKQLRTITHMNSFCGTWYYMSPDVVNGDGYGCKTDIWSLGCTVVEMLSSKPPWHELEGVAVIYCIGTSDKPNYRLPDQVSDVARNFLERCFIRDPLQRPSATELLRDPFACDMSTSLS